YRVRQFRDEAWTEMTDSDPGDSAPLACDLILLLGSQPRARETRGSRAKEGSHEKPLRRRERRGRARRARHPDEQGAPLAEVRRAGWAIRVDPVPPGRGRGGLDDVSGNQEGSGRAG